MTEQNGTDIFAEIEAIREARAAEMPTEMDAVKAIQRACARLNDLGWANAIYCPKDGSTFLALEAGFVPGRCMYIGEWPTGGWWIQEEDGDMWPSRPSLFRPLTDAERIKPKEESL